MALGAEVAGLASAYGGSKLMGFRWIGNTVVLPSGCRRK
jgi:hypothetical protein